MSVEDAVELGQRSIYHATFRDAVSGGTVSGKLQTLEFALSAKLIQKWGVNVAGVLRQAPLWTMMSAVYHVTEKGWTKVRGEDVGELHYKYYKAPEDHPCNGNLQL